MSVPRKIYPLAFSLFYFSGTTLFAQNKNDSLFNPLDTRYTPPISQPQWQQPKNFFGGNGFQSTSNYIIYGLNILPFEYLRGNLVVENEIATMGSLNITIGVGYNVSNGYLDGRSFKEIKGETTSGPINYGIGLAEILKYGRYQKGGTFVSVGFKNYVSNLANYLENDGVPFNGWYTLNRVAYFSRDIIMPDKINNLPVATGQKVNLKTFLVSSGFGYAFTTSGTIKTIHGFYIALGANINRHHEFKLTYNANTSNLEYQKAQSSTTYKIGALMFGYSFGLGI